MSWPAAVQTLKASFFCIFFFFFAQKNKKQNKTQNPKTGKQTEIPQNHILKMAGLL